METITLTGRDSKLSRTQIELVKARIELAFPTANVLVKLSNSRGDRLQHVPLQTVQGTDFFTEEVFENLYTGAADIAVHSLKDMSAAHFFDVNAFAVVDRDDVHDVAIFNPTVLKKLRLSHPIIIGTCSPRREIMATRFLKDALPQGEHEIQIQTKFIRGNVDTRLRKLDSGDFDGIILAAAGLNRLLRHSVYRESIQLLLESKKLMVLPLIECTPAPCQGAIVAEALPHNKRAVEILNAINRVDCFEACMNEKKIALHYGAGCDQKFGVTTIQYASHSAIFASGADESEHEFNDWHGLSDVDINEKMIWDGSGLKTSNAIPIDGVPEISDDIIFVANARAVHAKIENQLTGKRIWAAGSKTWLKLAARGLWVEGCADGLGLASLADTWASRLVNINKNNTTILTHQTAAIQWKEKGWHALGTYHIDSNISVNAAEAEQLQSADFLFWSSANQYQQFKHWVKPGALHACASGETFNQIKSSGVQPILFPTIESFQQWKINIPSPTEG